MPLRLYIAYALMLALGLFFAIVAFHLTRGSRERGAVRRRKHAARAARAATAVAERG